jgi:hypothetical protein
LSPLAKPGVRLLFRQFNPVEMALRIDPQHFRTGQQIRDVVGQGTPDQEFHREVVSASGIYSVLSLLCLEPAQGQHVAQRSRDRLIAFTRRRQSRVDRVIEHRMAIVQCVGIAVKADAPY